MNTALLLFKSHLLFRATTVHPKVRCDQGPSFNWTTQQLCHYVSQAPNTQKTWSLFIKSPRI